MKGGLLLIGGAAGYMTGFMMQRGAIIICGDAGPALADSMYEGVVVMGFPSSLISLIIIAVGLVQAWGVNRRVALAFKGPFKLAPAAAPTPPND